MTVPAAPAPARLCVFDLDGTLIDSLPDIAESLNDMLATFGIAPLALSDVRPMIGDGIAILVQRAIAASGTPDIDRTEAAARFLSLYTPRATRLTQLFPGARDTLRHLREAGFACAVCTNKPVDAARAILAQLGILDAFVAVSGGDSFPVRKPDPLHVRLAIDAAGGTAAQSVMIGDHANDVLAGNGCGARTVFARWGYGTAAMASGATVAADRIRDVPRLIARMSV